jgi:hypothetical protein
MTALEAASISRSTSVAKASRLAAAPAGSLETLLAVVGATLGVFMA